MNPIFGRLVTAMVTPFNENLSVDFGRARDLALRLVEQSHDGLVLAGTTGESPTLSHDEHERVIATVVECAAGRAKVLAGTGSNSTSEAVRLTRFAALLIVDRGLGTASAMRESWSMWRTRFWNLFALELLTFCAEFVGIAAAGIGYILIRPFVTLFWTAAYLDAIEDWPDQDETKPSS